jgi:hypothetical protein
VIATWMFHLWPKTDGLTGMYCHCSWNFIGTISS